MHAYIYIYMCIYTYIHMSISPSIRLYIYACHVISCKEKIQLNQQTTKYEFCPQYFKSRCVRLFGVTCSCAGKDIAIKTNVQLQASQGHKAFCQVRVRSKLEKSDLVTIQQNVLRSKNSCKEDNCWKGISTKHPKSGFEAVHNRRDELPIEKKWFEEEAWRKQPTEIDLRR